MMSTWAGGRDLCMGSTEQTLRSILMSSGAKTARVTCRLKPGTAIYVGTRISGYCDLREVDLA